MKTELAKALVTSSLSLAAVSCKGDKGSSGTIPLASLDVAAAVVCAFPNATCNVTNNESQAIFCSISVNIFTDGPNIPPNNSNIIINPGFTFGVTVNNTSSFVLCDALCWNDTGMINTDVLACG